MTSAVYAQTQWELKDLFPAVDSPQLEQAFQNMEQLTAAFEQSRSSLRSGMPADEFFKLVSQLEKINYEAHRLNGFAYLVFSSDTQNQTALTLMARVDQFLAEIMNRVLFFSLWWKDLDEAEAQRLMQSAGDLRYWLEEMRHFKPHTLSEAEEQIVNIKNVTGSNALNTLYDSLTNRYVFKLEVDGEQKELTRGQLMIYARSADPDLRARAYQELYSVYGNDGPILGQIYQTLVRDWRNEQISLRKYASPISARNLVNDIPDAVVDTLLEVARKNVNIFQRFFQLKAKLLGMPRLRRYDIYAPVAEAGKTYSFEDACQMVFSSFNEFDPRIAEMAERVFAQGHLDSEVRKGKMSGAFCLTAVPDVTPWVLLNYQGRSDDVSTMAHELGHAVHSMLASDHSVFTFHAVLPLAETASTFGEMLLVDKLLKEESDQSVRRDLLFAQVDDAYATIQRQAFFAMFERQAHQMVQDGASVSELADAYLENLKTQFGDAVEVSDEFRWEWTSIPHIYGVPFYVYAYSFGQLLVLSLYRQFKQEGESFKPRYLKILSTGGAEAPAKILADAGIDITSAGFWQGGFDVVRDMVEELERMTAQG